MSEITVLDRDEVKRRWLRSVLLRNPSAETGEGSQPYLDAETFADQSAIQYNNARIISANTNSATRTGTALDEYGARKGVPRRQAVGATGYVAIRAGTGGTTILANDELINTGTGFKYRVLVGGLYLNAQHVPVVGKTTGPSTNLAGGTTLQWVSPRPNCSQLCTVVTQVDGTGLSGGRLQEGDEEYSARIDNLEANKPASGNDSDYQHVGYETPDLMAEQVFTYPCMLGPTTTGVTCTIRPSRSGASRAPSAAQLALLYAHVVSAFPADDNSFPIALLTQNLDLEYMFAWAAGAAGWANNVPWPRYGATTPVAGSGGVYCSASTDATHFTLATTNADYTTCGAPTAGTVLGFFDPPFGVFRRKTLLTVAGAGPFVCVASTVNGASDETYTPAAGIPGTGQRCCPWSDSLDLVAAAVRTMCDGLGPGEQRALFTDAGLRQKRSPAQPQTWPCDVTKALALGPLRQLTCHANSDLYTERLCNIGTPGATAYLQVLRYLTIYPGTY